MNSKIVGLTGPSGAGKSFVAEIMKQFGCYIIDADKIYRIISDTNVEYLCKISKTFGREVLNSDGSLNRKLLAEKVFSDNKKLKKLNSIAHPIILNEIYREIDKATTKYDIIIVDAPLLFETNLHKKCDFTIGIITPDEVRIKRLIARDKIDATIAKHRFLSQNSNDFFSNQCNIIISGDCDKKTMLEKINIIINKIRENSLCPREQKLF